jgi:hypothetical protein
MHNYAHKLVTWPDGDFPGFPLLEALCNIASQKLYAKHLKCCYSSFISHLEGLWKEQRDSLHAHSLFCRVRESHGAVLIGGPDLQDFISMTRERERGKERERERGRERGGREGGGGGGGERGRILGERRSFHKK